MIETTDSTGLAKLLYGANPAPECANDPDLFFGPDSFVDEPDSCRVQRIKAARALCAVCPVRRACKAFALCIRPAAGVWAGYNADAGEIEDLAAASRPDVPVEISPQVAA